jgi:hypothetical protein
MHAAQQQTHNSNTKPNNGPHLTQTYYCTTNTHLARPCKVERFVDRQVGLMRIELRHVRRTRPVVESAGPPARAERRLAVEPQLTPHLPRRR